MTHFSWATDIHLDHLHDEQQIIDFATSLVKDNPAGVFLTGDISIAPDLVYHLSAIERVVQRPIYFVLGNHDYYNGEIAAVRKQMHELSNMSQFLKYLPETPYVPLSPTTAVVGHDGWYDCGYGNWKTSSFLMTDWMAIKEFAPLSGGRAGMHSGNFNRGSIVTLAQKLAHEACVHVQKGIQAAVRYHKTIIVLTHYPPYAQAHLHRGVPGDDNALPWYTSKLMGDLLTQAAATFPNVSFVVLSGHTHGKTTFQAAKNLVVHVGGAEYGQPQLQSLITI